MLHGRAVTTSRPARAGTKAAAQCPSLLHHRENIWEQKLQPILASELFSHEAVGHFCGSRADSVSEWRETRSLEPLETQQAGQGSLGGDHSGCPGLSQF